MNISLTCFKNVFIVFVQLYFKNRTVTWLTMKSIANCLACRINVTLVGVFLFCWKSLLPPKFWLNWLVRKFAFSQSIVWWENPHLRNCRICWSFSPIKLWIWVDINGIFLIVPRVGERDRHKGSRRQNFVPCLS